MCLWCFYFRELLFYKSSFPDEVGAEVAEQFTLYMQRKISTNRVGKIYQQSFLQELTKVMRFPSPPPLILRNLQQTTLLLYSLGTYSFRT